MSTLQFDWKPIQSAPVDKTIMVWYGGLPRPAKLIDRKYCVWECAATGYKLSTEPTYWDYCPEGPKQLTQPPLAVPDPNRDYRKDPLVPSGYRIVGRVSWKYRTEPEHFHKDAISSDDGLHWYHVSRVGEPGTQTLVAEPEEVSV